MTTIALVIGLVFINWIAPGTGMHIDPLKGAAGVTGSGFITLAATLPVVGHVPVEAVALVLGIDRFMSEARALTNIIGNTTATLVVAKYEGALDTEVLAAQLGGDEVQTFRD